MMAAAGDILMRDFITHSSSSLGKPFNSDDETIIMRSADEVDAVPTRSGIKKIKHEDNGAYTDEDLEFRESEDVNSSHIRGSIENSSTSESISNKEKSRPSFCSVFCALFSCQNLFKRYTILDLCLNLGAIGLYIFDLITDWLNAFNAYWFRIDEKGEDYRFYFGLTVAVITVPSIVMQVMSWWWEREDNREMKKSKEKNIARLGVFYYLRFFLSHVLQIGPVYRYIRTIYYGLKSRQRELYGSKRWKIYYVKYQGELADVNFVRLLESFLEAAPQIVLQIYIMIKTADVLPITVVSVGVSAFGMSSSYVTYQRALRNTLDDKEQLSIIATVVLFIYRSLVNLSRVLALALLLNTSVSAWLLGILLHWVLMALIIIRQEGKQKTHFCSTIRKQYFYDVIIGFCCIFSYINVHADQLNACRMILYYWLMFVENSTMALLWYYFHNDGSLLWELTGIGNKTDISESSTWSTSTALALLVTIVGSFCIGILFLALYYLFFHPKAPVKLCKRDEPQSTPARQSVTDSTHAEERELNGNVQLQLSHSPVRMTALRRLYVLQAVDKRSVSNITWSV